MELLVVITIIGVLASLTMVAVKDWQEKGRRAACLSNLRQIHGLILSYAHDHEDEFPPPTPPNAPVRVDERYNSLMQANLTRNVKIFRCPGRMASGPAPSQNVWDYEYNPNVMKKSGDGSDGSQKMLKFSLVRSAANSRLVWDSDDEEEDGIYDPLDNHGKGGGNVLYVDGHVKWWPGAKYDEKYEIEIE